MSDKSKIEWTDATWNPVTGCSKVSQGCKHCYALRDWKRLSANPKSVYYGREFTDVQCHHERLDQPLRWRKPRRIFVNSMSDLFHEAVPEEFIAQVFAYMAYARQHVFQVLTKRPGRMRDLLSDLEFNDLVNDALMVASHEAEECHARRGEFDPNERRSDDIRAYDPPWPLPNVWLGVSVEDQATAHERIPSLLDTPAAVRWISAEPLLGRLELINVAAMPWPSDPPGPVDASYVDTLRGERWFLRHGGRVGPDTVNKIDWIVAGGESGPRARPSHPDWFRSLRNQCADAAVPFLFKQWGNWSPASRGEDPGVQVIYPNGKVSNHWRAWQDTHKGRRGAAFIQRVGKKTAGRLLDGREHNELPAQGDPRA